MNEEYLWNKTGEDAEIEGLENALKAFRYQETAPPELPAKQLVFEEKQTRRTWFPFIFAFGSGFAVILFAVSLLFNFSAKKVDEAKNDTEIPAPKVEQKREEKTTLQTAVEPPKVLSEKNIETIKPKIVKVIESKSSVKVSNKQIARKIEVKKPSVKLTDEEKFAYDQLMIALSVTSSKLNIVKDKMKTIDEITVSKSER
ncbi:MAG TPA: hypothetical protein PKY59_18780 [Pyrinomonadaceae bacterium]|nr:hypothetical protein [Pyrinomonadaceae bacterium]